MKRKLDSKYKDLVDYVNSTKKVDHLSVIIYLLEYPNNIQHQIITDLNDGLTADDNMDRLIPIIVDVYNDNYEMEEPKYYVKLPKMSFPYVSLNEDGFYDVYSEINDKTKQKFTMSEIETIDPRYKAFAIPVSEVND